MVIIHKSIKFIYHIVDLKSGFVMSTFLTDTELEAQRSFEQELKNEDSMLHKYPDDFALIKDGKVVHTTFLQDRQVKTKTEVFDANSADESAE